MTTLARLQASFQRYVLDREVALLESIEPPRKGSAQQRAAIYADAYRIRLEEALVSNYPRLQRLVGESTFAHIANAYIDAHPSTHRSIRWFGHELSTSLRTGFPHQPWLAELAEWEWALASAFDSADAPPIVAHALSAIPAEEWATLRFYFHPSLRCLRMCTNAPHLFKALEDDVDVPSPSTTNETFWLIWRRQLTTRYRSMPSSEAHALDTLAQGNTFAAMCTTLCDWVDHEKLALYAAQLLRGWIDEELVCKIVCAARADAR
jgi:hypothetical protein